MTDTTLAKYLATHIERVDKRVLRAPGTYDKDGESVRRAATQVLALCDRLPFGTFVGPIGPERTKPQFLLQFEQKSGQRVVLKVYGKSRPGEAIVQAAWRRAGVRVVDVLDAGNDPTSWLMLRAVRTSPIAPDGPLSRSRLATLSAELAAVLAPAHRVGTRLLANDEVSMTALQRLDAAVGHHLDVTLSALTRHGYPVRRDWRTLGTKLLAEHSATLLHGDLAVGNVVRDAADGGLLLLDSCGYLGPAEFDAARWSARIGGAAGATVALTSWLAVEPGLNGKRARDLLALELMMEAGVHELVKEEQGKSWCDPDPATEQLLIAAERVLMGDPNFLGL